MAAPRSWSVSRRSVSSFRSPARPKPEAPGTMRILIAGGGSGGHILPALAGVRAPRGRGTGGAPAWGRGPRGRLGIETSERVVLVFGGSQAVRRFDDAVDAALPSLVQRATVIHVTGEAGYGAAPARPRAPPGAGAPPRAARPGPDGAPPRAAGGAPSRSLGRRGAADANAELLLALA